MSLVFRAGVTLYQPENKAPFDDHPGISFPRSRQLCRYRDLRGGKTLCGEWVKVHPRAAARAGNFADRT